jgi:tripartite-type tricarboxylate transporter receptor subunit TctC
VVVPYAAGGPTNTVAQLITQSMSKTLKQEIIITNVAGSGGTVGTERAAKSSADGYTLLIANIGHATSAALYKKLPYNPSDDFEPIGLITDVPMTLLGRKDIPAKDLKELLPYIKANANKMTLGNAGNGSASQLCGLLFIDAINTPITVIPYIGTGPAMANLVDGQIDLMCDQTTNTLKYITDGNVKTFGVTTKARIASLPNIPTLDESGLRGFEIVVWHGLFAPKGTPKPVIDKLSAALKIALQDPKVITEFNKLGTEPAKEAQATPEALRTHLKSEIAKWTPIIKKTGLSID